MGGLLYNISDTNPNDHNGSGGCLCRETTHPDAAGPYAVFYATDGESVNSPHQVLCAGCALGAAADIQAKLAEEAPEEEL